MIATHTADVYAGNITLCNVKADPDNANMVFGTVVHDSRGILPLHTGRRVWIAAAQVSSRSI